MSLNTLFPLKMIKIWYTSLSMKLDIALNAKKKILFGIPFDKTKPVKLPKKEENSLEVEEMVKKDKKL